MDDPAPESELRDWLRELKGQSGASYAEIGRAIGEEERTVKRWMPANAAADVVVPRGDALLKLLDFFGVTLTPPAPRAVAMSLLGELRDVRADLARLRGDEVEDEDELSLRRLDRRLAELAALVGRALDALGELAPPDEKRSRATGRTPDRRKGAR